METGLAHWKDQEFPFVEFLVRFNDFETLDSLNAESSIGFEAQDGWVLAILDLDKKRAIFIMGEQNPAGLAQISIAARIEVKDEQIDLKIIEKTACSARA